MTAFYDKNRAKGLHIFNVLGQQTPEAEWRKTMTSNKVNFVATLFEGNNFDAYPAGAFPYTYVIGADGKVKFQGDRGTNLDWIPVVEKELPLVKHPFLGLRDVPKELDKAAGAYTAGKFGDAYKQAEELEGSDDEKVAAAARALTDKIDARIDYRKERVKLAKSERRYHHAIAILEELSGKAYKGLDVCEDAAEELKELKQDKDVKLELKAWDALEKTLAENEKAKSDVERKKNLLKFYEKNDGTAAAEEARRLAEAIS